MSSHNVLRFHRNNMFNFKTDGSTKYERENCSFTQYSDRNGVKYVRCKQCLAAGIIRDELLRLTWPHTCHHVEDLESRDGYAASDAGSHVDSVAGSHVDSHDDSDVDSVDGSDTKADDPKISDKLKLKMEQLKKIKKAGTSTGMKMQKIQIYSVVSVNVAITSLKKMCP
jgi:hypothetical protein